MPSEALTARRAGREAEKTKEGPLIRYNKIERRHEKHSVNTKKEITNLVVDNISRTSAETTG